MEMRMGVYYAVVALLAVTTLSVIDVTHGAAINGKTSAQQLMDAIPVEDRGYFIAAQLAKAVKLTRHNITVYSGEQNDDSMDLMVYTEDQQNKYKDTEVPEDFCLKLLQWYENNMNQFQHRPFHRRRGRVTVCDPNGCVDPGDIGNVCCPF